MVVPGMTKGGQVCEKPADSISIYPTVCELLGVTPPEGQLTGASMVPLLKNPQANWKHNAVIENFPGSFSVRSEGWRYTRYAAGGEELYDHSVDHNEYTNCLHPSNNPLEKHFAIRDQLKKYLVDNDIPIGNVAPRIYSSKNVKFLEECLEKYPDADTDRDEVLSKDEWAKYKKANNIRMKKQK